jgi:hypothetical protein
MRYVRNLFLTLAITCAPVANALAQDISSANFMITFCRGAIEPAMVKAATTAYYEGICMGQIEGLAFVAHLLPAQYNSCRPQGVVNAQVMRVVLRYIENKPARLHENFRQLALEAMHEAWPC